MQLLCAYMRKIEILSKGQRLEYRAKPNHVDYHVWMGQLRMMRREIDKAERDLVESMRADEYTWDEIAQIMSKSKSAVHAMFAKH